jgi:serine/threonine protein kinase
MNWFEVGSTVFIAMEYVPDGTLESWLDETAPFEEFEVKVIAYQILKALEIMHGYKIIHRDLSLKARNPSTHHTDTNLSQNILIAKGRPDWQIKLADFGLSKQQSMLSTTAGTPMFTAPEIKLKEFRANYTNKVDIWSLGSILFYLLAHQYFCSGGNIESWDDLLRYCKRETSFPADVLLNHGISTAGIAFLQCLLQPLPQDRYTAIQALEDAGWFDEDFKEQAEIPSTVSQQSLQDISVEPKSFMFSRGKLTTERGATVRAPEIENELSGNLQGLQQLAVHDKSDFKDQKGSQDENNAKLEDDSQNKSNPEYEDESQYKNQPQNLEDIYERKEEDTIVVKVNDVVKQVSTTEKWIEGIGRFVKSKS